jgi:DNA-binding IclR family transcriptional regulator
VITITRTNRATGRTFVTHHPDDETARLFVEHSLYDHTKATRAGARAVSRAIMAFGHAVNQTETRMFLWTVNRRAS